MIDHLSLGVSDLARSRRFYDAVLGAIGLARIIDFEDRGSDYGAMAAPHDFELGVEFTITRENSPCPSTGMHICFRAQDRESVRRFYNAALGTGGRDDGAPGLRTNYHPDYFGAFVLDPDGHRIEAACHVPARE
jgi:catechol 2,3-dioxygenase-like lactoylglutathione lyase family enzyme